MADSVIHVQASWVSGLQFTATGEGSGATMVLDGAPAYGGVDAGMRPLEALLGSIAGCTGMDVISILKKKRQPVKSLEIHVTGERATEHPKRYTSIHLEFVARGMDVSEAALKRAVQLSQERYCAATASLVVPIECTCRVEPEIQATDAGQSQ